MEAAVLFSPAFLFVFPVFIDGFPSLTINEAIGLAFIIELFGYSSSVAAYWKRHQIDFSLAKSVLMVTIPAAISFRFLSFIIEPQILLSVFGLLLLALAFIIFRFRNIHAADINQRHPQFETVHIRTSDRTTLSSGGALAGLIGIGIGEITNTYLLLRKRVPARISTGTSALILHLTILSALVANFSIIGGLIPFLHVDNFQIPLSVAAIIAPTVLVGGQIGAFINSRLNTRSIMRILMLVYVVVGIIILTRILLV